LDWLPFLRAGVGLPDMCSFWARLRKPITGLWGRFPRWLFAIIKPPAIYTLFYRGSGLFKRGGFRSFPRSAEGRGAKNPHPQKSWRPKIPFFSSSTTPTRVHHFPPWGGQFYFQRAKMGGRRKSVLSGFARTGSQGTLMPPGAFLGQVPAAGPKGGAGGSVGCCRCLRCDPKNTTTVIHDGNWAKL